MTSRGATRAFSILTEKLAAIKAVADKAHAVGNYAFVYVAGFECITAHAADVQHSLYKDHPDWVQRNITGQPALFGGGTAFWIRAGDEDAWVSPYVPEWRKMYMEHVRQIATTGIDGIYVDIPYWMTHFTGWETTWASFDKYTVAEFKSRSGLDAMTDLKLGDFSDPNFRRWVDFRIASITEFMKEVRDNMKSVNPQSVTIAEIYPGIESAAVRVGSDVYQLYDVVDVIAHEYNWEGGSSRRGQNAARLAALDDRHVQLSGLCRGKAYLDAELFLGRRARRQPRRGDAEPVHFAARGGNELLGRARPWDGRLKRYCHAHGDFWVDCPARASLLQFPNDHPPARRIFSPRTRDYFCEEFHGFLPGADGLADAFPPRI